MQELLCLIRVMWNFVLPCTGLAEAMSTEKSKSDIAWILRHTMDAILADTQGENRTFYGNLEWLPKQGSMPENEDNEMGMADYCTGITSMVPSTYYNSASLPVILPGTDLIVESKSLLSLSTISTGLDASAAMLGFTTKELGIVLSLICLVCSL